MVELISQQNTFCFVIAKSKSIKVEMDIFGNGADLILVPPFRCDDFNREYKNFIKFVKRDGLMPCNIWVINFPDNWCSMPAVSKKSYPNAMLVIDGQYEPGYKTFNFGCL